MTNNKSNWYRKQGIYTIDDLYRFFLSLNDKRISFSSFVEYSKFNGFKPYWEMDMWFNFQKIKINNEKITSFSLERKIKNSLKNNI